MTLGQNVSKAIFAAPQRLLRHLPANLPSGFSGEYGAVYARGLVCREDPETFISETQNIISISGRA
jgi:hypothetical protein